MCMHILRDLYSSPLSRFVLLITYMMIRLQSIELALALRALLIIKSITKINID